MGFEPAAERLKRILVMVPWIHSHPGVKMDELCARFGIDRDTLIADLNVIQCSGIPPFTPLDMIEVDMTGDAVTLRMADHVATPPRLTVEEARELVIRARAVARLPGLGEAPALRSAIDKLTAAIGVMGEQVEVDLDVPGAEHIAALRAAVRDHARLHLEYYSHGRGEMTEREIDPLRVFYAYGAWYVDALDVSAGEQRTFRLDRIRTLRATGDTFEPPPEAERAAHLAGPIVTPGPDDLDVTLDLAPRAVWIAEAVPIEHTIKRPDGTLRVRLRTAHLGWVVRLLLAAAPHARAVAPPELVDAVDVAVAAALDAYGVGSGE